MSEDLNPSFAKATEGREKRDIEKLEKELENCQKKAEEYLAGWQRARADFLNYKKGEIERISELLKYGIEELILKILPILDNFEMIEKKMPEDLKNNGNVAGILQLRTQMLDLLKSYGVEEIRTLGEKFDPNFHEVVEEIGGKEPSIVVEEVQKGYKINSQLLRPAKVKISK